MALLSPNSNLPRLQQQTIERIRLIEKLEQAEHHPLTLIAAPPGYGKTTLVAQFAHRTALPVAWHTVEKREHDLPNLFEHCLSALSSVVPTIVDIQEPSATTPGELAALVADHLRETLQNDIVYVLDDVHHLLNAPDAESWLRALIASLPPVCHLILAGRALPPIAITELVVRREILAIGQEQLGFNFHEVGELAEKLGMTLSPQQVQKIFSRLDGWPAGILLALQPLPADLEAALFSDSRGGPEGLFDALAEVMLRAQTPPLQDFLLSSSTLSRMTPALCQSALRLSDSLEHLTDVLNRHLFITEIPGGVVYHALFRDFLQRQLRAQDPARFAQLHTDAGRWFEADNRLDEAFEHYVAAERWEEAAAIAERAVHSYFARGYAETVLQWKAHLDRAKITVPRLSHFCAMIHRDRYDYDRASAALAEAEEGFRSRGNDTGLIQIALFKAAMNNQRGDYRQALAQAEPFVHQPSVPDNLRGWALAIIGIAHSRLGNVEEAVRHLEAALPIWRATGDAYALAHLLIDLEVAYLDQGRFTDAATCLEEVLAIRRALGGSVGIVMALNNLGYHYHLLGEYQQALLTFREAMRVASRAPESRAEGYVLLSMGDLARDRGAFDEAAVLYQRALQLTGDSEPILRSHLLVSTATLRRWEGKLDEARAQALEAIAFTGKHSLGLETLQAEVALRAIQVAQGDAAPARQSLEHVIEDRRSPIRLAQALGVCAHAALLDSDVPNAGRYLQLAVNTAHHPANLQPLVAEIVHTPLLKTFVLDHARRYDVLVQGIRQLEDAQVETPQPVQTGRKKNGAATYSLRVWTLGQERIERDGKPVPLSAWQAAAARELFFFLLFKGASTREQIGLAFWPDCSMQQVRQKFHTTLHRVRDAVGANVIVYEDDLYSINPGVDIWCDAHEFETVIRQAQLTSPLLAHTELLWRRAVELYRGDFLSAFDAEWVTGYRESLAALYLDALHALGNCVRVRGNPQEAIAIFQRILAIDPFREDVHRSLLSCYASLGERGSVVRHLDELTRLLEAELGVTPSLETRALVQTLLS